MPLVSLDRVSIAYGHLPLLDAASLQIEAGERVSLIGRNGTGKSTLLQILSGELPPDAGTVWRQPGVRVARLEQDVPLSAHRAVFDVVAEGLGDLRDVITAYHHAVHDVAESGGSGGALDRLGTSSTSSRSATAGISSSASSWSCRGCSCQPMRLSTRCRAAGAGACCWRGRWSAQPDLLLLDEPTNHLDIEAITWLEAFLADYAGAVVFVTHDRAFLQRLATRIVELDRGQLTSWPGDYATYLRRRRRSGWRTRRR